LLCTEDDNSCYRNVCKMSVVSFALAVVFIIKPMRSVLQYALRMSLWTTCYAGSQWTGAAYRAQALPGSTMSTKVAC